jgi:hypothetical protein
VVRAGQPDIGRPETGRDRQRFLVPGGGLLLKALTSATLGCVIVAITDARDATEERGWPS